MSGKNVLQGLVPVDFAELYPRLYPIIGLSVRGKLLDWWIHKQYGAFKVITKIYYPEQPRTGKQQGWKSVFYDAVYNWRQFDDPTKNYYNERSKRIGEYGYHRYLSYYLKANFPMIIYWEPLQQNASYNVTLADYIASPYFGIPLYPPAASKVVSLGPSGELVLPDNPISKNIQLKFEPSTDVTASGLIISATVDTNAEGIGAPLMLAADGHFDTADASVSPTSPAVVLALETGTGTKRVLVHGILRNDGWNWTTGPGKASLIYVSITLGTLTQTQPSATDEVIQPVGWALSDDCIYFCPSLIYFTHT